MLLQQWKALFVGGSLEFRLDVQCTIHTLSSFYQLPFTIHSQSARRIMGSRRSKVYGKKEQHTRQGMLCEGPVPRCLDDQFYLFWAPRQTYISLRTSSSLFSLLFTSNRQQSEWYSRRILTKTLRKLVFSSSFIWKSLKRKKSKER